MKRDISTMKDFLMELARKRQSVRGYSDRPVEREKIMRCIETARLAPSACNAQPWKFIIVDDPGLKNEIAAQTSGGILPLNHFTRQAPVCVVVTMEPANLTSRFGSAVKEKHFPLIDIGITTDHFCLQAAEEELGTCIIGWFNEKKVRKLLAIPKSSRPVLIITLGYPFNPAVRPKKRKTSDEIFSWNGYSP